MQLFFSFLVCFVAPQLHVHTCVRKSIGDADLGVAWPGGTLGSHQLIRPTSHRNCLLLQCPCSCQRRKWIKSNLGHDSSPNVSIRLLANFTAATPIETHTLGSNAMNIGTAAAIEKISFARRSPFVYYTRANEVTRRFGAFLCYLLLLLTTHFGADSFW